MRLSTEAIVVALRAHGEHGGIVRLLTPDHGLLAGYVGGAKGRRMRPILVPGNKVQAVLSSRTDAQLAQATVELVESRAPILAEPLPAAAIDWVCVMSASILPEGQPYPRLYEALDGLLAAIIAAPSASSWGSAVVRYELFLLGELGFGLDLDSCAVTGAEEELVAVSPKTGRAVSAGAAEPYGSKLLPLPAFLRDGGNASWEEVLDGMALTGHFLKRALLVERPASVGDARERLIGRLRRAAGLA